jgi:hypothetical protein
MTDMKEIIQRILESTPLVPTELAELRSHYHVCAMTTNHPDDIEGRCALCDRTIYYRLSAPKRPHKICLPCLGKMAEKEKHDGTNQRPA